MTLEELRKRFEQYKGSAELSYENAAKALDDKDFEKAKTLRQEGDELIEKAKEYKAQIDAMRGSEGLSIDDDSDPGGKAVRMPFNTDEPEEEDPEDAVKSVYQIRFGSEDSAIKAVAADLYGNDYNQKRADQYRNFVKYVRVGESKMSMEERASLDELIYTPDTIAQEVRAGYDVKDIKANKTDQQESILQLGGALVPEDARMQVLRRIEGATTVRSRSTVISTARDAVEFPRLEGGNSRYISGVRVTWADSEIPASATFAQTNFELGTIRIPVNVVMARTDLSLNLLEDSGLDVIGFISEQFGSALRVDENEQFLTGRGGGKPKGILGKGTAAEPAPDDGVSEVNSGDASALTADGLIDLSYNPDAQYLQNAVWLGAKDTFKRVRKLKDGNGDYLWERGIENGEPPTLLGYPFFMDEAMPSVAANAYPLIFGDLMGYYIVERVGMTIQRVQDTTTIGRNKAAIFLRRRVGGQVVLPWMLHVQKVSA
jgi:HK97 family phage major capsid protein